MFEIVSGFTTTGASILPKVEDYAKAIPHLAQLFPLDRRHGNPGVYPGRSAHGRGLQYASSCGRRARGPSVGKLVPKIRFTAKLLYSIYLFMTVVMILLLLAGSMPLFDSLCMTLRSCRYRRICLPQFQARRAIRLYQQGVITIFMLLFGVNFNVYYLFLIRKPKDAFQL